MPAAVIDRNSTQCTGRMSLEPLVLVWNQNWLGSLAGTAEMNVKIDFESVAPPGVSESPNCYFPG